MTTAGLAAVLLSVATCSPHAFDRPGISAQVLRSLLYYIPVGFTLEEVTFRAVVDDDLADARPYVGLATAILSSGLWGLWHLPIVAGELHFGSTVTVVATHVLVGVPLAMSYRRSGNLVVPAVVHAFADAVRDALET